MAASVTGVRIPRPERGDQRGQVLPLFVIGSLTMIAMVALVVDGGNAYAQERITQNGTDAAAQAGATAIAQGLGGAPMTDADVLDAIEDSATAMQVQVTGAEYTDIGGDRIGTTVGSIGGAAPPSGASGVAVSGRRNFGTFFARAIGLDQMTTDTQATAIAGAGQPRRSGLLPVTPPINIVTCDGQNDPTFQLPPTHWNAYAFYRVPLCKNGPGNVGWIDWSPTSGGTSELVDAILDPSNTPPIALPSWQYVTETGNVNSHNVEDALRTYDGQVVLIPIFDSTCNLQPPGPEVADCPPAHVGGNGQNQWYHFPEVAAFEFCDGSVAGCPLPHGSYVNGNNSSACDTGNGSTSCLVGRFVNFITEGTVTGPLSATPRPSKVIIVQLIR